MKKLQGGEGIEGWLFGQVGLFGGEDASGDEHDEHRDAERVRDGAGVLDTRRGAGELVVLPIVLGVAYPLLRTAEAHLPDWLTRILLGSTSTPNYTNRQTPLDR